MDEQKELMQAVLHQLEELKALYDGLLNITASKDNIQRLEDKIDKMLEMQKIQGESINILALRQLQTESEVSALKKAK